MVTSLRSSHSQGRNVGNITFGARDTQGTYDTKDLSWNTDVSHTLGTRFAGTATVNYFRYEQVTGDTFADPSFSTYTILEGTPNALFPNGVRLVRLIDQSEFDALVGGRRDAGARAVPGVGNELRFHVERLAAANGVRPARSPLPGRLHVGCGPAGERRI